MTPLSPEERAAAERVSRYGDPVSECRRRWADYAYTLRDVRDADGVLLGTLVDARWRVRGEEHGLRDRADAVPGAGGAPVRSEKGVALARERVARCALQNDEIRKAARS